MSDGVDNTSKVSVVLPNEAIDSIRKIAATNKTSLATAIADSVKMYELLTEAEKGHARILLRYPSGRMTEVVTTRE